MSFHIAFIEENSSVNQEYVDPALAAIAASLRFSFRFRSEILDRFRHDLKSAEDVEEFGNVLHRIESDAQSRGAVEPEKLYSVLDERDEQTIRNMQNMWYEIRRPEGDGKLDDAIRNQDFGTINSILSDLRPMNREYMTLLLKKFTEYMEEAE